MKTDDKNKQIETTRALMEQFASLHRKINELVRRLTEGTLRWAYILQGLQRLIEAKAIVYTESGEPIYPHKISFRLKGVSLDSWPKIAKFLTTKPIRGFDISVLSRQLTGEGLAKFFQAITTSDVELVFIPVINMDKKSMNSLADLNQWATDRGLRFLSLHEGFLFSCAGNSQYETFHIIGPIYSWCVRRTTSGLSSVELRQNDQSALRSSGRRAALVFARV